MNLLWLLRMRRWAQRPPGWRRVKLGFWVLAACLALVAIERTFGWPEALTVAPMSGPRLPI